MNAKVMDMNEKMGRRDINREKRLISEYGRLSANRERSLADKVAATYASRDIAYHNTPCFHSHDSSAVRHGLEPKAPPAWHTVLPSAPVAKVNFKPPWHILSIFAATACIIQPWSKD